MQQKTIEFINTTLSCLPRTLLMTLKARAEETERNDHIIYDPVAAEWFYRIKEEKRLKSRGKILFETIIM